MCVWGRTCRKCRWLHVRYNQTDDPSDRIKSTKSKRTIDWEKLNSDFCNIVFYLFTLSFLTPILCLLMSKSSLQYRANKIYAYDSSISHVRPSMSLVLRNGLIKFNHAKLQSQLPNHIEASSFELIWIWTNHQPKTMRQICNWGWKSLL